MKNEKWFKDILSEVKFGDGFPIAQFYYHPLYKVGVGKDTNLDFTFGKDRKLPLKNLRKFKFFRFEAPFPTDSVIFFQPDRKRLIISSQKEGKVLKISVSPGQLSLLEGEIKELKHQNNSSFAPHSVKLLSYGSNWIMTSFSSNQDSVSRMPILELHELLMGPMTKFYLSHELNKVLLSSWIDQAKRRAVGHPSNFLIQKLICKLNQGFEIWLLEGWLHFDLHHGNILRDRDKIVIIDWEVSRRGLLLVDFFDFYRRFVKESGIQNEKIVDTLTSSCFFNRFQLWLGQFGLTIPRDSEKVFLSLYALERTLIYFETWGEDRLVDKNGFEYKIAMI